MHQWQSTRGFAGVDENAIKPLVDVFGLAKQEPELRVGDEGTPFAMGSAVQFIACIEHPHTRGAMLHIAPSHEECDPLWPMHHRTWFAATSPLTFLGMSATN